MPLDVTRQYTDKKTIQRAEERVAWFKKAVGRYQEIARGGKDGTTAAVSLLKDTRDTVRRLKDDILSKPSLARFMRASVYAAEERAYDFVINLFENPKVHMAQFETQLKEAEKELSDLRKIPGRD